MGVVTLSGWGQSLPIVSYVEGMKEQLRDLSPLLREIAEEIVLPAFGRHYDNSGLKTHSGLTKTAVTTPGAKGNVLRITPHGMSVGVSYNALPSLRWAFEGRPAVYARSKKALRFYTSDGKAIFAKHVRAADPHPVIFLTPSEWDLIAHAATQKLVRMGTRPITK